MRYVFRTFSGLTGCPGVTAAWEAHVRGFSAPTLVRITVHHVCMFACREQAKYYSRMHTVICATLWLLFAVDSAKAIFPSFETHGEELGPCGLRSSARVGSVRIICRFGSGQVGSMESFVGSGRFGSGMFGSGPPPPLVPPFFCAFSTAELCPFFSSAVARHRKEMFPAA